jgi:hypothetical protein
MDHVGNVSATVLDKMDKSGKTGTAFKTIENRLKNFDLIGLASDMINGLDDLVHGRQIGYNSKQGAINMNKAISRAKQVMGMSDAERQAVYSQMANTLSKTPFIKVPDYYSWIDQQEQLSQMGNQSQQDMIDRHRQKMGLGISQYGGMIVSPQGGMMGCPHCGCGCKKKKSNVTNGKHNKRLSMLSNFDLDIAQKIGIKPFNVYMHTELPKYLNNEDYIIVNLDHGEEGTHWVAIANQPKKKFVALIVLVFHLVI